MSYNWDPKAAAWGPEGGVPVTGVKFGGKGTTIFGSTIHNDTRGQGSFGIDDGLVISDSNPVFIADKGGLSATANNADSPTITPSTPSTPPSTRPYIWKYQ